MERLVPIDCEQSVFLAEIVSGDAKGTIVTVECFRGQNATEVRDTNFVARSRTYLREQRWKHNFQRYSEDM